MNNLFHPLDRMRKALTRNGRTGDAWTIVDEALAALDSEDPE
jgi:hypothetical protein